MLTNTLSFFWPWPRKRLWVQVKNCFALWEVGSFLKFHHSCSLWTCCVAFEGVSTSCFLCIGVSRALSDCTLGTCHFALVLFLSYIELGVGIMFISKVCVAPGGWSTMFLELAKMVFSETSTTTTITNRRHCHHYHYHVSQVGGIKSPVAFTLSWNYHQCFFSKVLHEWCWGSMTFWLIAFSFTA